jgi:hypothetical protein
MYIALVDAEGRAPSDRWVDNRQLAAGGALRGNVRELADLPTTSGDQFRLHDLGRLRWPKRLRRGPALLRARENHRSKLAKIA